MILALIWADSRLLLGKSLTRNEVSIFPFDARLTALGGRALSLIVFTLTQ